MENSNNCHVNADIFLKKLYTFKRYITRYIIYRYKAITYHVYPIIIILSMSNEIILLYLTN